MKYTAAQRLDRLPEAAFHKRLVAMIAAGIFFDTFDLYLASGVMLALTSSGWATLQQNAQFLSVGFVGMMIGALAAGVLGDRFGRRFSFQINLALFGLTSLIAALAPNMNTLVALRFVMCIGLGAEAVVGYGMLGEFIPPARRGRWAAILNVTGNSSFLVSTVVSFFVIPHFGWRWMFAIVGVGALITWSVRKAIPESPRWLESVGRHDEADRIVSAIEAEIAQKHVLPEPQASAQRPLRTFRLADLFGRKLIRATLLGMLLYVVVFSGLYGFIIWVPTFLMKTGLTASASLGYSALMASGSIVGAGLASPLSDRIGRKWGIVAMSLISAALGIVYPNMGTVVGTTIVGWFLVASLYFCGALSFAAYVPEIFPTELRLRGTAVASVAGRLASAIAPLVVVYVVQRGWGINGVTGILASLLVLQAVVVALFGIETRGRSLDTQFDEIGIGSEMDSGATVSASPFK
jgi:putative MFS transporter